MNSLLNLRHFWIADSDKYDTKYVTLDIDSSEKEKSIKNIDIFDNKGTLLNHVVSTNSTKKINYDYTTYWKSEIGIPRDDILKKSTNLFKYNKIVIVCEILYSGEVEENLRLINDYEALLNGGNFSDISLVSEGKTLKLHKCILAQRNSVFAAMFETDMIERKNNRVEITDIKYDVHMEMIRYLYIRRVNNIETLAGELAIAADKYALDDLKLMCEKTMGKNLCISNLVESIELANKFRMNILRERCIEFIIENAKDVADTTVFNALPDDIVRKAFYLSISKRKEV